MEEYEASHAVATVVIIEGYLNYLEKYKESYRMDLCYLFDFDGTLVDSMPTYVSAIQRNPCRGG